MASRIIVVEDDPEQARLLKLHLESDGHLVFVAKDGLQALDEIRRRGPDLVLLDVMMPRLDGLDVCRVIRRESEVPIIMITARSGEDDVLLGLELGADDYIAKPYRPRELLARVRAMLRRSASDEVLPASLEVGELRVDLERRELFVEGSLVDVTVKKFDLLTTLLTEPGQILTRARLLERAFGFDYQGLDRTVDAHVRNLRRKIGDDPAAPRFIETIYGVGYRLIDDARSTR